ncbi:MAG: YabP family protein [Firmicutes bacterium ADurb.Bin506]|nr:MAG: YabP family protein [Firmicutes bacterium ADurb.Bin506]
MARKEASGRSIAARAWRAVGARGDVILGLPLITLEGSERLALENHQGVSEYTPSSLVVLTASGPVRVCGRGLRLVSLSKQSLVIQGTLTSVTLGVVEAD